jgi:hypothetical protein
MISSNRCITMGVRVPSIRITNVTVRVVMIIAVAITMAEITVIIEVLVTFIHIADIIVVSPISMRRVAMTCITVRHVRMIGVVRMCHIRMTIGVGVSMAISRS